MANGGVRTAAGGGTIVVGMKSGRRVFTVLSLASQCLWEVLQVRRIVHGIAPVTAARARQVLLGHNRQMIKVYVQMVAQLCTCVIRTTS